MYFRLQMENDNLLGKKSKHSLELQNERINLPDDIDVIIYVLNVLKKVFQNDLSRLAYNQRFDFFEAK